MSTRLRRHLSALVVLVVAADWLSKLWVVNRVALGGTIEVVEGWFYIAHRRNTGIAFSMLADLPGVWGLLLIVSLSGFALFALLRLARFTPDGWVRFACVLVAAGAVGNLGDRLLDGGVTDFLLLPFFPFVFNVADAAITMGGTLLAVRFLFGDADAERPAPA